MNLHSADSHSGASGKDFEFLFFADGPGNQSSGNDRAETFHGEDAVDGQAGQGRRVFHRNFRGDLGERGFQLVETCARQRTHRDYRRLCRSEK